MSSIQLLIKTLNRNILVAEVNSSDSIKSLKSNILSNEGMSSMERNVLLCSNTQILNSEGSVGDYNLQNGQMLYLTGVLAGGKKKKKEFLTPKKVKKVRKPLKLKFIKNFTVVDGKVQSKLKSCQKCGEGFFLSKNGQRCGHCVEIKNGVRP